MVVFAGGNVASPTPTLVYLNYGAFTITNYDSALTYNLTASVSSQSGSTFSVTGTSASAALSSTTPKGSNSPGSVTAFRLPYSTYFVQTGPPVVSYSTSYNGGTFYNTNQWSPGSPAGYYAVTTPGYYAVTDYSGSGYTFSSTYNEWYKIV